jgi:4'-phosphopantetheinyl transferase EntD
MPLISIENLRGDVSLGLWRIDESTEDFFRLYPHLRTFEPFLHEKYGHDARRLEFLSVRALLFEMTHEKHLTIDHQPSGKPLLSNQWHLSISHTRGFAALMLSPTRRVGVDIEYVSERINRIARRFIRPDEQAPDTTARLINWCAKETAYKYYSDDRLDYFEMRVLLADNPGELSVENLKRGETISMQSRVTPHYVLTFCHEK